jgi:DNA-binding Lrp family transcriptional regulator
LTPSTCACWTPCRPTPRSATRIWRPAWRCRRPVCGAWKRLAEAGIIERRGPAVARQLGAGLSAILEITLDRQGAELLEAFEARAVAEPAVQQCWRVSPGPDFVLVVQVADMPAYHALTQRLLTSDANVRNVKAFFSVKRAKFEPRLTLPAEAKQAC